MKEKKAELSKQRIATNLAQEASLLSGANGWRVGPHGLIQKTDARGNWFTVPSGVDADLFDISFPAPNVGWAVGQSGLILRTTDQGKTWSRISAPTSEDLIKVTASSALAAQIETRIGQTLADGRRRRNPGPLPSPSKCHPLEFCGIRGHDPSPAVWGRGETRAAG